MNRVVRDDDARRGELEADGWRVVHRSWGARLDADRVDVGLLRGLVGRVEASGATVRELGPADVEAVLALDAATLGDYPGGVATAHAPLTAARATTGPGRRAFGVLVGGALAAMTYVDVDVDGRRAETDFTVVAPARRGLGLATAVKAASVLALRADGVRAFRTGGSDLNAAILAANGLLGYVVDERWLTYDRPEGPAPQA